MIYVSKITIRNVDLGTQMVILHFKILRFIL